MNRYCPDWDDEGRVLFRCSKCAAFWTLLLLFMGIPLAIVAMLIWVAMTWRGRIFASTLLFFICVPFP